MAASNEWTEWHLTPRGWEKGDERMDFGDIKRRDTPGDRVMSTKYSEYAGSVYSQLHKSVQTEWEHPDKALVTKLLEQFGAPPENL